MAQKIKDYFKPLVLAEMCNRGKSRDYDYGYFYTKHCDYDYDQIKKIKKRVCNRLCSNS